MCLQFIKLKTKSQNGLKYGYVPCGKCADCRKKIKQSWNFRLNSEFLELKKKGWNVAFCTLTYSDENLPKIPEDCFKDVSQYREINCFNKQEVSEWIANVRQYCKYHYSFVKGNNIRYFIASEYGSNTKRPHYHAILAWPSVLSYEKMHALCTHYWKSGFLFPRKPEGDGKCLSFEVVGDATRALGYVSKYACKDIDFEEEVQDLDMYSNVRDYAEGTAERLNAQIYRNCRPFHIQSVSLGFELIKNMSDEQKREVFVNGMSFVGDGQVYRVPLYIKNRIVFDNYYQMEEEVDKETGEVTYKRVVRRKASAFFEKYRKEIFEEKSKFYHKYVYGTTKEWMLQNGVDKEKAEKYDYAIKQCYEKVKEVFNENDLANDNMMGKMYLAYNNIPFENCFDIDLCEQYMRRYREDDKNKKYEVYNGYALASLKNYWEWIDEANTYIGVSKIGDREAQDKLNKRILDFFNNVVQ